MTPSIVIGSRGSRLALTQSEYIAGRLRDLSPGLEVRIEVISTVGDRILDRPLAEIGDKGLFTKELEAALEEGSIDLAVHSLKDLPTDLPEPFIVGAVPGRENPSDAFVCTRWSSLDALPDGAVVGTSSLRRKAQLLAYRPALKIVDLRGNVDTRRRKVLEGELDAAVLAYAGLHRLGLTQGVAQILPPEIMVSAVGQGALGVEMRKDDPERRALVSQLTDPDTWDEVMAERALLAALEGGCQVPIGALARVQGDHLSLTACVCSLDGLKILRAKLAGPRTAPEALGRRAADELLDQGAAAIMAAIR